MYDFTTQPHIALIDNNTTGHAQYTDEVRLDYLSALNYSPGDYKSGMEAKFA